MGEIILITKWQKQNMRAGFKETFKPLIESQESIKKSVDEQQDATIKELKKNQLALTKGLQRNRIRLSKTRWFFNFDYNVEALSEISNDANENVKKLTGKIAGKKKNET